MYMPLLMSTFLSPLLPLNYAATATNIHPDKQDFICNMLAKLDWPALRAAATALEAGDLPEEVQYCNTQVHGVSSQYELGSVPGRVGRRIDCWNALLCVYGSVDDDLCAAVP